MATDDTSTECSDDAPAAKDSDHVGELPKVDFSTFVLSLGTTALYQLGVMANPESGEVAEADPLIAQQTIDTLEMLREKSRGNLD